MAFQTGTASSFSDLQSKIETFLTGNGYTLTSGIITKTGTQIHVEFTNDTLNLFLEMGKDSSAGSLLHTHPLRTSSKTQIVGMGSNFNSSGGASAIVFPVNYDFQVWANPENEFRCVIEYNNSFTQNVGFGEIIKSVDMDGGVYVDATGCLDDNSVNIGAARISTYNTFQCSNNNSSSRTGSNPTPFGYGRTGLTGYTASTQLWAEFMGFDWFISTDVNGPTESGNKYIRSTDTFFTPLRTTQHNYKEMDNSLQTYNANSALVPIRLYGQNPNNNYAPIGSIRNIRYLNVKNLNFGEVVDDGTDKWKVYPSYFKNAATLDGGVNHSGQMGFAVRYDGP
jgi:hypothetical protein